MISDVEKIRHYFVKSAESFDSLYSEEKANWLMNYINHKFRRDIYERFLLSLNHFDKYKTESILDVGCGSGRYESSLSSFKIKKITGLDCSQRMIELARTNIKQHQELELKTNFLCYDFEEYQSDETYDVVIAMGFFDYIKAPVNFLKKMSKLSNHSVIASFPSISFYRTPIRKIRYFFKNCPVYFYDIKMLEEFSKTAGFSRVDITKIKGAGMDYFVAFYK